jgi:hypothetical protein
MISLTPYRVGDSPLYFLLPAFTLAVLYTQHMLNEYSRMSGIYNRSHSFLVSTISIFTTYTEFCKQLIN